MYLAIAISFPPNIFRAMDAPRTGSAANDIAATSSGVCHQAQQGTAIFADEY